MDDESYSWGPHLLRNANHPRVRVLFSNSHLHEVNAGRSFLAAVGASIPEELARAPGQARIDEPSNSATRSIEHFRANRSTITRHFESHRGHVIAGVG